MKTIWKVWKLYPRLIVHFEKKSANFGDHLWPKLGYRGGAASSVQFAGTLTLN